MSTVMASFNKTMRQMTANYWNVLVTKMSQQKTQTRRHWVKC